MLDDSNWSSLGESDGESISDKMENLLRPETECFSVASGPYDDALALEQYQSAWEVLMPHERTCNIASSSSGFEMVRRSSDEPERTRGDDTAG